MNRPHGNKPGNTRSERAPLRKAAAPGWADGLRKLYDDVLSEPLPDSFNELLKKLDRASDG